MELFWNSLNNAPSYIVFYLEMKIGVHDIRSDIPTYVKAAAHEACFNNFLSTCSH